MKITKFNQIDNKIDRRSSTGTYYIDPITKRPRNPIGRTGSKKEKSLKSRFYSIELCEIETIFKKGGFTRNKRLSKLRGVEITLPEIKI